METIKTDEKLKLGVIGLSKGNGHPYSWSAIFNGFDNNFHCPFKVIPEYLEKEKYPDSFLTDLAEVTHIWTQSLDISNEVASFSKINNVVKKKEDLINFVDAVLLARDDAENHLEFVRPFIEAGIPIFIDKPLAFSYKEAKEILNMGKKNNQIIFTCSAMRFAKEFDFIFGSDEYSYVEASIMKDWKKYAIHIIEPVVKMFPERGSLLEIRKLFNDKDIVKVLVRWASLTAIFTVTGTVKSPLQITLQGKETYREIHFEDTFYAFRESLRYFIQLVHKRKANLSESDVLEIVRIIENGDK